MPSLSGAASGAGFTRGFRVGLESARQRRIEEEERKRQREREDFDMEQARLEAERRGELHPLDVESRRLAIDTAREEAGRRKELHPIDVESRRASLESARYGLERQKVVDAREDELYPIEREKQRLSLASARRAFEQEPEDRRRRMEREDFSFGRERIEAGREDKDRARAEAEAAAREFPELFAGLEEGLDPNLLLRRYNASSPKKLVSIAYDPETGMVRLEDDDGDIAEHPLEQWRQAYPLPQGDLEKLGKDDRLVDPRTGKTVVGPATGETGRDVSPYNPQTVQDDLTAGIVRSMGGEFDAFGRYSFGSTEDRQLGDYRIALAQRLAGQLEPYLMATRITPGEIVNAVMEATKDVPSDTELERRAEQWRTKGVNKTPEQAREWLEAERTKVRAEAERRLASWVQRAVGRQAASVDMMDTTPSWAGNVIEGLSAETIDPETGRPLDPDYTYYFDIDGRPTAVKVGPDGRVYEVAGEAPPERVTRRPAPAEPPSREPARAPQSDTSSTTAPTEPSARRASGGYGRGEPGIRDEVALFSDLYRSKPWIRSPAERERRALESLETLRNQRAQRAQRAAAQRVAKAFTEGRQPTRRDLRSLEGLDSQALIGLGLTPEQAEAIRADTALRVTLSDARRASEFVY